MSQESLAVQPVLPLGWRIRRFLFRVTIGLLFTGGCILVTMHQVDLVQDEGILQYPLMVALDGVDASLLSTELTATAVVREGSVPTMEELKRLADRVAFGQHGDVDLWSDVNDHFQAVYFQGQDPAGGAWTASARYVSGGPDANGTVEISLRRDLYGRIDDMRTALQQMKGRLQIAGGLPVKDVQFDVRLQARPRTDEEPERLIESLMRLSGVDQYSLSHDGILWQATGYSPRIVDFTYIGDQRVNVAARVTQRGQDRWIELGSPIIQ